MHDEGRSYIKLRFECDGTVIVVANMLDDGKSETGVTILPASCLIDTEKAFKDTGLILLADTDTGVRNHQKAFFFLYGDVDFSVLPVVLDGIVKKVPGNPIKVLGIHLDKQRFIVLLDLNILFLALGKQGRKNGIDGLGDIDFLDRTERFLLDGSNGEHIGDDLGHSLTVKDAFIDGKRRIRDGTVLDQLQIS